jgi:tight adherence protein C
MEHLSLLVDVAGGPVEFLVLAGVFVGVLTAVIGARALLAPPDATERRLASSTGKRAQGAIAPVPLRQGSEGLESVGFTRFIAPIDLRERQRVQQQLVRAGFRGEQALMSYYLIRTILGILLPLPLVLGALAASATARTAEARLPVVDLDMSSSMMLACMLLVVGFYGPPLWLRRRITARQGAIRDGFPHALDMMQVAIEAGLGFDSALARVASELKHAHPALAEEFVIVGLELRAGKARDQVLADLASRTQVDAISVFTKVILQSISFGTSIASTLQSYAREMRHKRMSAAEEKANQLPVRMSVIMVVFLLPTIFLLALSPVLIRLIRMFSGGILPIN